VTGASLVRVMRSGLAESVHLGDVAVVDADGRVVAAVGDPEHVAFARSCMKPLQAAVSLSLTPIAFPDDEVAVMCASHNGEAVHVRTVRAMLERAGVEEAALRCPAMLPWDEETRLASPDRLAINSDCSGKHGGMLAACRAQGWPQESYRDADHPLQEQLYGAVLAATDLPDVRVGVDGCGVPVHGFTLRSMATIYARLASPDRLGTLEPHARRAASAMLAQPYLVAGRDRVDTALMRAAPGVVVKAGAEGMICAAITPTGMGVALKVRDGSPRATGPALIRVLRLLGTLDERAEEDLAPYARPPVLGGGVPVGEVIADFDL
jgi:L-asparaginase II